MNHGHVQNFIYGSYCRKSSESEDKQIQSIDRQVDELKMLQKQENLIVFGDYITESKSAFSPGREGFGQLVKWTYDGKINAWLCWHASRLSRNPVDAGNIIYLMDIGLLHHIKTKTRTYFNTPSDKFMLQLEFSMSKKDSDDKSQFVKSGLYKRYRKGLPTGKAFIGFINDMTKEKGDRGWKVHKERFQKVQLLLKRFLKGHDSISSVGEYARNELVLTTPKSKRQGGKLLPDSYIYHVLTNPIPAGFFFASDENGIKKRYELDPQLPRMISENEHYQILDILRNRTSSKWHKRQALYTGLITDPEGGYIGADFKFQLICDCKNKFAYLNRNHCPICKKSLKELKRPKYLSYVYYYNTKRRKAKGITAKAVRGERINQFLIDYTRENLSLSKSLSDWAIKHLPEVEKKADLERQKLLADQEKFIQTIQQKKKKLRQMYMAEMITAEEYKEDIAELDARYAKIKSSYRHQDWKKGPEELFGLVADLHIILEKGTSEEKKDILQRLGSNLTWDEEKLNINNTRLVDAFIQARQNLKAEFDWFEPENYVVPKGQNTHFRVLYPSMLRLLDDVRTSIQEDKKVDVNL